MSGGAGAPFWEHLAEGAIRIPRCAGCERWTWPAQYRCGECGGYDFTWREINPVGTVFSWTRTHHPFDRDLAASGPYTVIVGELPSADGARLLGLLADGSAPVVIGHPVSAGIRLDDRGPRVVWELR